MQRRVLQLTQLQQRRAFSAAAAMRGTQALLGPSKKRGPGKGIRSASAAAKRRKMPPLPEPPVPATLAASAQRPIEIENSMDIDDLGHGTESTGGSTAAAAATIAVEGRKEKKPAPMEFSLDGTGAVPLMGEAATNATAASPSTESGLGSQQRQQHQHPPRQQRGAHRAQTAQTRAALNALLARVHETLCEPAGNTATTAASSSSPLPPRVLSVAHAVAAGGEDGEQQEQAAEIRFFEPAVRPPPLPSAVAAGSSGTGMLAQGECVQLFADAFAATLSLWSPHTASEQLLMTAAATDPGSVHTLPTAAPLVAMAGRFQEVAREVDRCGPIAMLANSLVALCGSSARTVLFSGGDDDATRDSDAAAFVRPLMDAIAATATGTGDHTLYLRPSRGLKALRDGSGGGGGGHSSRGPTATASSEGEQRLCTHAAVLQRVALELFLATALLRSPAGNGTDSEEGLDRRANRRAVGRAMLRHITTDAVYRFHIKPRRGVDAGTGRMTGPGASAAPIAVTYRGLASLIRYSFQKQLTFSGGNGDNSKGGPMGNPREERRVRDALTTVCALYFSLLPEAVHACSAASLDRNGAPVNRAVGVVSDVAATWALCERQVRVEGIVAALPWLRVAPALLTAFTLATETRMELAVMDGDDGAAGQTTAATASGCTRADDADLASAAAAAAGLITTLFAYDRSAFERHLSTSGGGVQSGDGGESTEADGAAPLDRKRGKRSLFYKDAEADKDSILIKDGGDGTAAGGDGGKGASRFASRAGGDGSPSAPPPATTAPPTTTTTATASSAAVAGDPSAGALFDAVVQSRETAPVLCERYAIDRLHREPTVEDCWLALVHALGRTQRLLYSPPSSATAADDAFSSPSSSSPSSSSSAPLAVRAGAVSLSPSHLPVRLRALIASRPAGSRPQQERRLAAALRLLVSAQALLPTEVFDGLLRSADRLSSVLTRIAESGQGPTTTPSGSGGLGIVDIRRQQRRLGVFFSVGVQELVWLDGGGAWQGIWRAWQLRMAPAPRSPAALVASHPGWSAAGNKLLLRLADEQFKVAGRRKDGRHGELVAVAREALRCLSPGGEGTGKHRKGRGTAAGGLPSAAPLGAMGRQSAAALLITSLHACVDTSVRRGEYAGHVATLGTSAALRAEIESVFLSFLSVLEADPELLLLCCYPVFLQVLYETYMHINRSVGGSAAVRQRLHAFARGSLMPTLMPAVIDSLRTSGDEGETAAVSASGSTTAGGAIASVQASHATVCELTMLLLAELSSYCTTRRPKVSDEPVGAEDLADGAAAHWDEVVMQVAVYCLRQTRRGGLKKQRDLDLPPPTLPAVPAWSAECRRRCDWLVGGGGGGHNSAAGSGAFIRFLNLSNDLVIQGYVKSALNSQDSSSVAALQDYHHVLDSRVTFAGIRQHRQHRGHGKPTTTTAAVDKCTPAELVERLCRNHAEMAAWREAVAVARREAIRHTPFFASRDASSNSGGSGRHGGGTTPAARRLRYLVQFMDMHLQKEERRARSAAITATAGNTDVSSGGRRDVGAAVALATVRSGDTLPYGLSALDDSPLIVLDLLCYLTGEGGWAMVGRALCVCDTAFKVERRRHRHALAEVREIAVAAVLSQLRVVPPPHIPVVLLGAITTSTAATLRPLPPSYLSLSLLQSACSLSDAVAKDGSLTLLGCGRRDPVTAMLSSPSSEEYRGMLYGVKQVTVYVDAEAQRYRGVRGMDGGSGPAEAVKDTGEDDKEDEEDAGLRDDADADTDGMRAAFEQSFFDFIVAHGKLGNNSNSAGNGEEEGVEKSSDAAATLCQRYREDYRAYVAALVSAIDLNLECARHHALQVGVMDAGMRELLAVSYATLVRAFVQAARALICLLGGDNSINNTTLGAHAGLFADEAALLSLAGLCTSASVAQVMQLDHAGVFFTTATRNLSLEMIDTVQRLVTATAESRRKSPPTPPTAAAAVSSPLSVSVLDDVDSAAFPVTTTLIRAVEIFSSDIRFSRRVLLRFGLSQYRERRDLTVTLLALYAPASRAVAAAAATATATVEHASSSPSTYSSPTGRAVQLLHGVWASVQRELASEVRVVGGGEDDDDDGGAAGTHPTKNRKKESDGKKLPARGRSAPAAATLPVPSIDELRLVLGAFADFDPTSATTTSSSTATWACEAATMEKMMARVREDPAMLPPGTAGRPLLTVAPSKAAAAHAADDFFDDDAATANEDEDAARDALALAQQQQQQGRAGHNITWSSAFLSVFPDIEEALADGGGDSEGAAAMTPEEMIDSVIQQGKTLRRVHKAREKGGAPLMAAQLHRMKGDFYRNVVALLAAFPLARIAAQPEAADGFFSALDVFVNPSNHAAHAAVTAADPATASEGRLADMHQRQAVCEVLTRKLNDELIAPYEAAFLEKQAVLLEAVRLERGFSSGGSGRGTSAPSHASAATADVFEPVLGERGGCDGSPWVPAVLTATAQRFSHRSLLQETAADEPSFGLSWQDDIRQVTGTVGGAQGRRLSGAYGDCMKPPAHAVVAAVAAKRSRKAPAAVDGDGQQQTAAPALPLDATFALLRTLVNGEKDDPATRGLATAAATYAMRQHVLLRPRLAGTAMNVLPILYGADACGGGGGDSSGGDSLSIALGPRDVQVLLDWRLPLTSPSVDAIGGRFFSPAQRQAFLRQYSAATGNGAAGGENEAGHSEGSTTATATATATSAEALVFAYVRSAALYLHLLSVVSALLYKFELYGDMPQDEKSALKRRYMQMEKVARRDTGRREGRNGGGGGGGDASLASASLSGSAIREALHRELQATTLYRQTTVEGVNANLLEAAMLHFLNVSCVLVRHSDVLTHLAVDRTILRAASNSRGRGSGSGAAVVLTSGSSGGGGDATAAALTAYAGEIRGMLVAAFQDSVTTVMHQSERSAPLSLARRVLNHVLCTTPCTLLGEDQLLPAGVVGVVPPSVQLELRRWRETRPEWFACSPTMLAVVSPHYFLRCLANSMRVATSAAVSAVAACLAFYAERDDLALGPLLSATTELLTATAVRCTAITVFCERLAEALVRREEFRQALGRPTVASRDQGPAGSVSNEVLIPFLAAMARHDVRMSKATLAALLHTSMRARPQVFGLPPIPNRQGSMSLVKAGSTVGGSYDSANPLYANRDRQRRDDAAASAAAAASQPHSDGGGGDSAVLDAFSPDGDDAARTHRRGLAGLNITLPAVMEIAAHMRAARRLSRGEETRAKAMLRTADDARRERVAIYRSQVHAAGSAGPAFAAGRAEMAAAAVAKVDASLWLEDEGDYGVALLHLQYALRKVVHASYRRLAGHQSPRVVAEMLEMLLETDDGFRRWWRTQQIQNQPQQQLASTTRPTTVTSPRPARQQAAAQVRARRRAALGVTDPTSNSATALVVAATASAALSAAAASPAPLRDPMLSGTLRQLVARALTCAVAVGHDRGGPLELPALAPLPPAPMVAVARTAAAERAASTVLTNSLAPMSHRGRQRMLRALAAVRNANRSQARYDAVRAGTGAGTGSGGGGATFASRRQASSVRQ